jgi:hypothetical protein
VLEKKWKALTGAEVDLKRVVEEELALYPGAELHVGSDSQQVGQNTEYVTVAVIHRPGKGGRVFFCRERIPRVKELRERLWKEVWRSTELAMELTATPDIGTAPEVVVAAIHIDANVDPRHKSSKYVEELVGLVMGQGFNAMVKPESWAASHAADHAVKGKNEASHRKPHSQPRRNTGR